MDVRARHHLRAQSWNQNVGYNFDVQGSVAAVALPSGLHLFERTATGWAEAALDIPRPQGYAVSVDSGRVLAIESEGACAPEAVVLERGTNGHWNISAHLPAPAGACVCLGALDANAAALLSHPPGQAQGVVNSNALRIFERSGSAWIQAAQFASTESNTYGPQIYGPTLDIHSGLALVSSSDKGMHVYRRGGSGWTEGDPLKFPDSYDYAGQFARSIEITDAYVLAAGYNNNRQTDAAYLFRNDPVNAFPHLAVLTAAGSNGLYDAVIEGNRVLANGFGYPGIFELPTNFTTPPVAQDDFEAGPGPWQILPGSQFSVVQKGPSHAWRQSSLAGNAGAVFDADRTNQSVSAEITATAVNGNDRWVGLVTRYTDESNYYYVTIRGLTDDSERIVLKRLQNGVFTDLASYSVATGIGLDQRIRLTLESTGNYHAVYLDNVPIMRAYDGAHPHGKAGLRMYKAAAEFDNVVLDPGAADAAIDPGPGDRRWYMDVGAGRLAARACGADFARGRRTRHVRHAGGGFDRYRDVEDRRVQCRRHALGGADVAVRGFRQLLLRDPAQIERAVAAQADERRHHCARHGAADRDYGNAVPRAVRDRGGSPARIRERRAETGAGRGADRRRADGRADVPSAGDGEHVRAFLAVMMGTARDGS